MSDVILSEEKKRRFCAEMLRRYDVRISPDNELLPVLYLCYQAVRLQQKTTAKHLELLRSFEKKWQDSPPTPFVPSVTIRSASKASSTTKDPQAMGVDRCGKVIQFASSQQAFWFAFGLVGLPIIVVGSLLIFLMR